MGRESRDTAPNEWDDAVSEPSSVWPVALASPISPAPVRDEVMVPALAALAVPPDRGLGGRHMATGMPVDIGGRE